MINGEQSKQKKIESLHFADFKECCKGLPSCLQVKHDDNPDFLCTHNSGVLGIEHTQLFKITNHPNAPQALESFRQQIVGSAQKFCEKDVPPLWVNVWFNVNQKVPKNRKPEIKRISQAIAEFVKKWHQENPTKPYQDFKFPPEIPTTSQMIIAHAGNGQVGLPYHHWTVECPALVYNLTIEEIQSCINEKNRRYEEYLKKCDECWLLIAVDIFKDSQSFEIPDLIDHRFESKFERVFYMDVSHRKDLHELPIIRT